MFYLGLMKWLLPALSVGANEAIGSTYTFAAPVYLEIIKLYRCGMHEEARYLQSSVVDFIRCIIKHPSIAAQRAIMHMLGIDMGSPRLPLAPLSDEAYNKLKADLEGVSFFELLQSYAPTMN
jgi:N-acetylneuraminate lyase